MSARENAVIFGCGPKGSGKTTFLWRQFTSRAPRVLTLDSTGETTEIDPHAIATYGLDDTVRALRHCAEYSRWHIAAALDGVDELVQLLDILAPPYGSKRHGYSRAVGGMVLESSEIDEWAPNQGTRSEVVSAWRRGRHHNLSLYCATQRPASCARDVTAQADVLFSFAHHEPSEREFLARAIGRAVAEKIAELPPYHVAVYYRDQQRVYWCGPDGHTHRVTDPAGNELTSSSPRSTSQRRAPGARRAQ